MDEGTGDALRVEVLGPVRAWRGSDELALGTPQQRAVLAVLAARANRAVSRSELIDAVWGESLPATAEDAVYSYVARLRRVLEPERSARVLDRSGSGYVLRLAPGRLDAGVFEQHLGSARQAQARGDGAGAVRCFDAALAMWNGQPWAGVPGPFATIERARLTEQYVTAAEDRAEAMLGCGRHAELVAQLSPLAAEHPFRERLAGLLMLALYRSGRQAEALALYRETHRLLRDEQGVEPGSDLRQLHEQMLAADPALTPARAGHAAAPEAMHDAASAWDRAIRPAAPHAPSGDARTREEIPRSVPENPRPAEHGRSLRQRGPDTRLRRRVNAAVAAAAFLAMVLTAVLWSAGRHAATSEGLAFGTLLGKPLTGNTAAVNAVAVTTLGGRPVAVTGGHDNTIRIWDLARQTEIGPPIVPATGGSIESVAATALHGRPVAITGGSDDTVRIWDLTSRTELGPPLTGHADHVYAVAATTLGGLPVAVSGSGDGTLRIWNLDTYTQIGRDLNAHAGGYVTSVAVTTLDGRPVAVAGYTDDAIRIWDLAAHTQLGPPIHTGGGVYAVATTVLHGRPVAVTGSDDNTLRVWDLARRTETGRPMGGYGGSVNAIAVTALGGRPVAVTGSWDQSVRVWDLTDGGPIGWPITGQSGPVNSVAVTTLNGLPIVVAGSDDHDVRIWSLGPPRTGDTPAPTG